MKETFTCIDPALPLCWEDPDTLRLGFDRAEVRIPRPSASTQRLLGVLQRGLPLSDLPRASLLVGVSASERRALIELIAPVLVSRPLEATSGSTHHASRGGVRGKNRGASDARSELDSARRLQIAVLGTDGAAESLRSAVSRAAWVPLDWPEIPSAGLAHIDSVRAEYAGRKTTGHTRKRSARSGTELAGEAESPDLCIVVERFMQPPATFHSLTASGVPHLAVRFTDRSVRIGPLVIPGRAPCVSCLHLGEVAQDPGLPALAAQLQGRFPAAETTASIESSSALALSYVHQWQSGSDWPHTTQLRLTVTDGLPSPIPEEHSVLAHPDCACTTASATPGEAGTLSLTPRW